MYQEHVNSRRGTVLWMHEDVGAMVVSVEDDVQFHEIIGRCYHDIDSESGVDCLYQLTEYITGPMHSCVFQIKKVDDRHTLPDQNRHIMRQQICNCACHYL